MTQQPTTTKIVYSLIAHQMDIGTSLGGRHNYVDPISNLWPFWIPQPKLHGACYLIFFENLKMASFDYFKNIAAKRCFPGLFLSELRDLIKLNRYD